MKQSSFFTWFMGLVEGWLLVLMVAACAGSSRISGEETTHPCYSGIYPHLAYYNSQGECGTGAVVPWADRLWVVTYSPHEPWGSDDKLYEITPDLTEIIRQESIGGTPANRAIHRPSNQLFIGPYAIDSLRRVRVMPYDRIPGRPTGIAAHLTDPDNHILLATMESGFYDIDVHTLEAQTLYKDGNQMRREGSTGDLAPLLPGYHGKGFYSGQGVAVFSNNGEEGPLAQQQFDIPAGSLSEWDGKEWTVVRRNQFTEVTGPGGLSGNPHPDTNPIWALGWDYKSVLLAIRNAQYGWHYYRLPKASFAYDGAHGWNTEWPRIRDVGTERHPDYLMTMHGMFWHFPETFDLGHTSGIYPRGAYLKVVGDFCRWQGKLVFGCDDSAKSEFLNKRSQKGGIAGAGQSHSNLWFTSTTQPDHLGPTTAAGAIWLREDIKGNTPSDPFLFDGWANRCAWIENDADSPTTITFQIDKKGDGHWTTLKQITLAAHTSFFVPFDKGDPGIWIRAISQNDVRGSLQFVFAPKETRNTTPDPIFHGLASIDQPSTPALLYTLPDNQRTLGVLSGNADDSHYYTLDGDMNLQPCEDKEMETFIRQHLAIPHDVVTVDSSSVLIVDAKNRRWRLPLGDDRYSRLMEQDALRICREVVTERDLFSCHGTFYELPAENADGFAKIRPIASHRFAINDYASYRGMMVLSGILQQNSGTVQPHSAENKHIITSSTGDAGVWAGAIDDLWKLGKPIGHGGPWYHTDVSAGTPSDPFLIGFYDKRQVRLSHSSDHTVNFRIEVDPTGDGQWFHYADFPVPSGDTFLHTFPSSFQGRWIRAILDSDTEATMIFEYL